METTDSRTAYQRSQNDAHLTLNKATRWQTWSPDWPKRRRNNPQINQNDFQTVQVGTLRTRRVTCYPTRTPKRSPRRKSSSKSVPPGVHFGPFVGTKIVPTRVPKQDLTFDVKKGHCWLQKRIILEPKIAQILNEFIIGLELRSMNFIL